MRPQARLDFAQHLRELRIERGFRTARSLAKALEIDENRYTRYERAEVEPDLDLIRRICAVIGTTPDTLLGVASTEETGPHRTGDKSCRPRTAAESHPAADADSAVAIELASWQLACAVADARLGLAPPAQGSASPEAPRTSLATLEIASPLYRKLRQRPIETIAEIGSDAAMAKASTAIAARVTAAIDALLDLLRRSA